MKIYEKYPNCIKKEERDGKTYFRVVDFDMMKVAVGELLTEVYIYYTCYIVIYSLLYTSDRE